MKTIRFEHVSKRFPKALSASVDDVSLEVTAGQFVVLLGPSGCGKTTLLKMVNRLYEPTQGHIFIDEEAIHTIDATTLRRGIGYVIQQIGLFPHLTVAENIAVVPRLLKWQPDRITARVDELLSLIDLAPREYGDRYPAQLSGGQQQRVGLARALAADPGILLMDEPFGALDAITRTSLQDALLALQRRLHKTVLFVTHDIEEALRLADTIVVMNQGRVVQAAAPAALLAAPANAFVAELVGAGDMLRRLGLIRIQTVMGPVDPLQAHSPTVSMDSDLRQALSLLLHHDVEYVMIEDDGQLVGSVSLEHIRDALQQVIE